MHKSCKILCGSREGHSQKQALIGSSLCSREDSTCEARKGAQHGELGSADGTERADHREGQRLHSPNVPNEISKASVKYILANLANL